MKLIRASEVKPQKADAPIFVAAQPLMNCPEIVYLPGWETVKHDGDVPEVIVPTRAPF